ncbi:MAG: hypothetical protein DME19_18350 [Verrucomicrobia bacterium]|nr:MAG: hypothetical protein DME19_18350 [Verrucomicrobiota bacterium]
MARHCTNSAPIHGVATIGISGYIYLSILSTPTIRANVKKLSPSGPPIWTFNAPGDGTGYDMHAIPVLDAAGTKLYIGSDFGKFSCLNTSDGSTPVGWTDFTVPTGTDKRIRSGAALDPNNPLGSTVYFHCNNGYLYALDANTGAQRWTAYTANEGGPPVDPDFVTQPVSSSPVVDSSGVVFVGSSDGSVYSFNPSTGAQIWRVVLNPAAVEPVEATIAIGQNGILYVGTRVHPDTHIGGTMYAINPVTHTKLWTQVVGADVGYIASVVIDQSGFIYASHFGNTVRKLNPADGTTAQSWVLQGKVCQTPSLNQNGLLILGVSLFPGSPEVNEVEAIKIGDPNLFEPIWEIQQVAGQDLGNMLGSPAIRCATDGRTYVADMLGKVFLFNSGAPMMAGQWPTFQCGNRRAGKSITYPTVIAELPPFYSGNSVSTQVNRVDVFGRSVGQSYGFYDYACGSYSDQGYAGILWRINSVVHPGGCTFAYYTVNSFATGLNSIGDVCGYNSARSSGPTARTVTRCLRSSPRQQGPRVCVVQVG